MKYRILHERDYREDVIREIETLCLEEDLETRVDRSASELRPAGVALRPKGKRMFRSR